MHDHGLCLHGTSTGHSLRATTFDRSQQLQQLASRLEALCFVMANREPAPVEDIRQQGFHATSSTSRARRGPTSEQAGRHVGSVDSPREFLKLGAFHVGLLDGLGLLLDSCEKKLLGLDHETKIPCERNAPVNGSIPQWMVS